MSDEDLCIASGQIFSSNMLHQLARELANNGVHTEVRGSSHFKEGRYLLVRGNRALYKIEKIETEELLVRGEGESVEYMKAVSQKLSAALAKLNIKHRVEVYDSNEILAYYLHHNLAKN